MSLIGRRTLVPTTDPEELIKRDECAAAEHPPAAHNPWHHATWCRCGALVVAGNQAPPPEPHVRVPRGKHCPG